MNSLPFHQEVEESVKKKKKGILSFSLQWGECLQPE